MTRWRSFSPLPLYILSDSQNGERAPFCLEMHSFSTAKLTSTWRLHPRMDSALPSELHRWWLKTGAAEQKPSDQSLERVVEQVVDPPGVDGD